MTWLRRADAWWMQPLDARPLAFFRVSLGILAVLYFVGQWSNLTSSASFASNQFDPVGVVTILSEPIPAWMVHALLFAALLVAIAFALGWRFAVTGPLFAIILLWVLTYRNSWG